MKTSYILLFNIYIICWSVQFDKQMLPHNQPGRIQDSFGPVRRSRGQKSERPTQTERSAQPDPPIGPETHFESEVYHGSIYSEVHNGYTESVLRQQIGHYIKTKIIPTAQVEKLSESEKVLLFFFTQAAKYMDTIFKRQVWKSFKRTRREIKKADTPLSNLQLQLFDIMKGPWDKNNTPFAVDNERPIGAGFYPETFTTQEVFGEYAAIHPKAKLWMESVTTMLVTDKSGAIVAWPYSKFFKKELVPAARLLKAAAKQTENKSLKTFLRSRAKAFLGTGFGLDDYSQSDKDWIDVDSRVDITIGPYEPYEDTLMGLKASFEAFVTISDPEETSKLLKYKSLLPEMEENLPYADLMKTERGGQNPIHVVDLVFASGEARKTQFDAFNLPNDAKVREEKGSKNILLQNVIHAKFMKILTPIATELLDPLQKELLSQEAFFNNILFHELSHALGPVYVQNDKSKGEISKALGSSFLALEEGKADVMGVYNVIFMVKKKILAEELKQQSLITYVAELFRTMRAGTGNAHGKGAVVQFNRYMNEKAVIFTDKYHVDVQQLEISITKLVKDMCTLQHNGDKDAVDIFFEEFGNIDEETKRSLDTIEEIPGILLCYPMGGDKC